MYIAHAPISYLANELIQKEKIKKLQDYEQIIVGFVTLLAGILPDFDLFLSSMLGIPSFMHHDFLTHTPIFYIVIWGILRLLLHFSVNILNKKSKKVFSRDFLEILINSFLIGSIFHLLADTLVTKIMLFYPLTKSKFTLFYWLLEPNLFAGYFLSIMFVIELIFISIFILVIYKKYFKQSKIVNILVKGVVVISVILLPISLFIFLNTYNRSYMYDIKGNINYDIDFDILIDTMDIDIGNSGKNNIQKALPEDILASAQKIVDSKKWTGEKNSDLYSELRYKVGGFDSYRIISQAYYNIHLPIEAVLRDFSIRRDGFNGYSYNYDYPNLLFEYLKEKQQLEEIDMHNTLDIPLGKIFFLTDKDGTILNSGITLGGNSFATVLGTDNVLQEHSLKEMIALYEKKEILFLLQK